MTPHPTLKTDGYTVIEVLTVMIIGAILAVAAFSYYQHSDTDLISQTNILKTHIRYAQSRAMNADTPWGVRFDVDQRSYWLFQDPESNEPIALPGQTADMVDLGEMGLDITGTDVTIKFDSWGRPTLTETDRTFTDRQLSLSLNRDGIADDNNIITITENTGFIP